MTGRAIVAVITLMSAGQALGTCIEEVPPGQTRLAKPAFKGVELYSWKDKDGTYQWSMLTGTNRTKTEAEIRAATCVMRSIGEVKEALGKLAVGEHIFWLWDRRRCSFCKYPPRNTIDVLIQHAKSVGVCLTTDGPPCTDR